MRLPMAGMNYTLRMHGQVRFIVLFFQMASRCQILRPGFSLKMFTDRVR